MIRTLFVVFLFAAISQAMIHCPPGICEKIDCNDEVAEEDCVGAGGRHEPKGGMCGCCSNCVTQLEEGDSCWPQLILGAPRKAECKRGLVCDHQDVVCRRRTCAEEKLIAEDKIKQGILGAHTPTCMRDGTYHPKQCKETMCRCVSATGIDLGYAQKRWESEDMNCQCARDEHEFRERIGGIGRIFFCDDMGNYEAIQCHGSMCFCVDENGKQRPDIEAVPIHKVDLLKEKCY